MMNQKAFGAGNTVGFSSSISSGYLPSPTHITYEGLFNQIDFSVGPKTSQIIDISYGFAKFMNPHSLVDAQMNSYLALFLKGNTDGQPRDDRILNSVIALDISGSMDGPLSRKSSVKENKNRLDLCKEAIKMFVSKLRPSDSFGLVIFNNEGKIIVPSQKRESFDLQQLFAQVNNISINGGTTIKNGIKAGFECLMQNTQTNQLCENRLILLTDVMDSSLTHEKNYLQEFAEKGIHTTIIGVSEDFQSSICQVFKNVKGFNYFSATEDEDLKKYLFRNFDYTFFPATYNVNVVMQSQSISGIQVFGSPDSENVGAYNEKSEPNTFVITKIGTSFPSDIEIKEGEMHTVGGLILLKLKNTGKLSQFKAKIKINCLGLDKKEIIKQYDIIYNIPIQEQFFSSESVQEAMDAYQYVSEVKQLIKQVNENKIEEEMKKQRWMGSIQMLKKICPQKKLEETEKIEKIIEKKLQK